LSDSPDNVAGLDPATGRLPTVLIGGLAPKAGGAVHTVTSQFIAGLAGRFRFIPFALDRSAGLGRRAHFNITNLWYLLVHAASWIAALLRERPDIAHFPVTSGWNFPKSLLFLRLGRSMGARSIGHVHGGSMDVYWSRLPGWQKRRFTRLVGRVDAMVVLSEHWKTWAMKEWGLPERRVRVVFNPIEAWFEREALALEPSPNGSAFFLGSIGKRKGVHDIIALAELIREEGPRTTISLIGPEEYTGGLAMIVRKIDAGRLSDVRVLPPVAGPAKLAAFREHGVFLFPSHRENLPLVVLEAAAAARAIITTRVGGVPEFLVDGESVLFVEPGNIRQMQAALRRLTDDPDLRRRLGLAAREVFRRKLVRSTIMESLAGVYGDVLADGAILARGD
jgi:glycosyltransferase involved in cell wall biosynthesis